MHHSRTNMSSEAWVLYLVIILLVRSGDASILDWVWGVSQENAGPRPKIGDAPIVKVPFEVTTEDQQFLEAAKEYTSLKLSDLDTCQHVIVMKIRNSCSDLTEEELAKMSVNLLNCQSAIEGRQHFPCTSSMSLRECTSPMDPDMWNTYHLMNNRARAVCYAARHQQFRAVSEMTVNKLMEAAHSQLNTMNTLKEGQQKLESLTVNTLESVSVGHQALMDQQKKLRVAQHYIQDFVALNLRELTREKALIASGHRELAKMMEDVRNRLGEASADLSSQADERRENHKQLLEDLDNILDHVSLVWQSIDHSTQEILAQHASAAEQYSSALHKLSQINMTIGFMLNLLDKTRYELDERLGWIANLMGGTGDQLDRLYSCALHILYLIVGMIATAFIGAPSSTRVFLLLLVPMNLAVSYNHGDSAALNFPSMTILIVASIAVNYVIQTLLCYWAPRQPGPMYYLHGSQPQPMTNGFITNPLSLTNPVAPARARRTIIDRLWLITANSPRRLKSLVTSSWTSVMKSVLPAESSRGPTPGSDGRDRIPTPVSHRDLSDDSSDSDEVASQRDRFGERFAYCKSVWVGSDISPAPRQHPSTRLYSPPTPTRTSSRSGTPSHPGSPRQVCRAICRNGQQCRNNASLSNGVCRRHVFEPSSR